MGITDGRPTHLDLFSGIGGFALAAKWAGFRTIGFCEIDKYCQRVIAENFGIHSDPDKSNGSAEPWQQQEELAAQPDRICSRLSSDIRQLDGKQFAGVSLVTGGFPCQPFSCAGKRKGKEDDRHLWPEMLRVINEARPAWVLGENVTGIIGMELDTVLSDLETIGYAGRPFVIPACGVDARHRRNRVWIVAHAGCVDNDGRSGERGGPEGTRPRDWTSRPGEYPKHVADGNGAGMEGCEKAGNFGGSGAQCNELIERCSGSRCKWEPEPDVGRVAHGIPRRVDRLRGLGNAIVPQVAYQILRAISEQITTGEQEK